MSKIQKTHLIYAVISLCAVFAYSAFLLHNAIEEVDTVEETLPYPVEEEFEQVPVTEPLLEVIKPKEKVVRQEEPAPTEAPTIAPEGFSPIMPLDGRVEKSFSEKHIYNPITADWRNHTGIDICANMADKVYACEDGTVTACFTDPLWGNVIEIDHGEYISVYKNVSTLIMVKEGDSVRRGDAISGVGNLATAEKLPTPHIHFEMLHFGEYIDPLSLIG